MAVRSAQEISTSIRGILGEQEPDGLLEILEDVADSIGADPASYVSKVDYDTAVSERDKYKGMFEDMRTRYINRFYNDYNEPGNVGLIDSSAPQESVQEEEKRVSYDDLFE